MYHLTYIWNLKRQLNSQKQNRLMVARVGGRMSEGIQKGINFQ